MGRDHKFQPLWPERKHGLFTEQVPVSAYVGSSKNLMKLKDLKGTPSEIDRAPAVRQGVGSVCWATLQPVVGRRRKSRRMWGLQRARNARNWRSGLGAQRPAVGNASCRFHSTRKGWSETATRCQSPRDRRLLLAPSLTTRAMDGESANPCFGRRPAGGPNGACFCIPSELSCPILHSAATWCLLPSCIVNSNVGVLYGLFRIDLYESSCVGAIS